MAVFDVLVNNADRKGGHILGSGGHVFGVDHGVCFNTDPKLRTLLWGWAGAELTDDELRGRPAGPGRDPGPAVRAAGRARDRGAVEPRRTAAAPRPLPPSPLRPLPGHSLAPVLTDSAGAATPAQSRIPTSRCSNPRGVADPGSGGQRSARRPPLGWPACTHGPRPRCLGSIPSRSGPRLRLFDTAQQQLRARRTRGRRRAAGPVLRLRHHPVRRHPHRPRQHLRRLRPAEPGLARRRARRRLRAERHRRRRPAAGAGDPGRDRLAAARRRPDRAVPDRHDRTERHPAGALRRGRRVHRRGRRADRRAAGEGGGLRRRRRRLPGSLLRPVHRPRLRIAVPPRRRRGAGGLRRAGR